MSATLKNTNRKHTLNRASILLAHQSPAPAMLGTVIKPCMVASMLRLPSEKVAASDLNSADISMFLDGILNTGISKYGCYIEIL